MTTSQKISLRIERAWLLLPVSESAPDCRVSLSDASGHEVRLPFTAALSAEPQSWAPLPVGAWVGQTLELTAETTRDGQTLPELSALKWFQHDTPYALQQLYREPLRPLIHFSAPYGWLNDPNGLTFFNGEYHLFYQHNPFGTRWGNMHWGHATSTDLFSWTDWGDVLEPDRRRRLHGFGRVAARDRPRDRRAEALHDACRRGTFPDRIDRRRWRTSAQARRRIRRHDGTSAALRMV